MAGQSLAGEGPAPAVRAGATASTALLVLLLGSIVAVGAMSIDLYLPALPELTRSLDAGQSLTQLSLTGFLAGLGLGQVLIGPISDAAGRRRPLLAGMLVYVTASASCAHAWTVEMLVVLRFVQGFAAAAGSVIVHAMIRDITTGAHVARIISRLALVAGAVPTLAPSLGGQLLRLTGWRGLFWILAAFGTVLACLVLLCVRETLPPERRCRGIGDAIRSYRRLLADRRVLSYATTAALGYIALMAYVSGSSFIYQQVHEVSVQTYGLLFGLNALGLVAAHQLNAHLVLSIPPSRIIGRTAPVTVSAAVALTVTTSTEFLGLIGLVVPLFVVVSSLGLILPNATALALDLHPESAGATAAVVGCIQFTAGAVAAPLTGIGGPGTAVPMAVTIVAAALGIGLVAWRRAGARVSGWEVSRW